MIFLLLLQRYPRLEGLDDLPVVATKVGLGHIPVINTKVAVNQR